MAFKVSVDREKCNGCEECLEACTVGMFRMINGKASPLTDRECMGCESCVGVCDEERPYRDRYAGRAVQHLHESARGAG